MSWRDYAAGHKGPPIETPDGPMYIDPSEPCAACGVSLGEHRGEGMAVVSRADRDNHVFSLFSPPQIEDLYVRGGEFTMAKPKDWPTDARSEAPPEQ